MQTKITERMTIIRPRLNDYYNIAFTQEEVDFAIPFLDEDIPLYVDPFLLWKSPSLQDQSLHTVVVNSFNHLGYLVKRQKEREAIEILIKASECAEVGLGQANNRKGKRIGEKIAGDILNLFRDIPQIKDSGFIHFEEIQLYVDQISKDRISDIACSFIKSFLIDFTIDQCSRHKIPRHKTHLQNVYDYRTNKFCEEDLDLPTNPETGEAILLVPKRWLRFVPWINYEDYYEGYFVKEPLHNEQVRPNRIEVLNFNRNNYDLVHVYIAQKERTIADCKNDPLFNPIPILSAKKKLAQIKKLPSGKTDNADSKYEDLVSSLMASLLYPHLDFATEQSRTESGVLIRDLIFYNSRSMDFLQDIYRDYLSRQIVMELKNVKEIEREHINQLNRYLADHFGKFGILVTRNPLPQAMHKNTIDLWSGQRKCIIALTDVDLELMVTVFESKQRLPIEVIKKKYIEFMRGCPS